MINMNWKLGNFRQTLCQILKMGVELTTGGGGKIFIKKKYPCLSKMVRALLPCFHGTPVESSFNIMNDIIDDKSGRIKVETYNAILNIKYGLKASRNSAIQYFGKKDYLHEGINTNLIRNMRTSCKSYKEELEQKRATKGENKNKLNIRPKQKLVTKRKAKKIAAKAAKKARVTHMQCVSKKH